jgi:hypothetical protein
MRLFAAVLAAALVALVPAAAQAGVGPDYVTSDNVEYLGSIKFDVGQTTGAKIVGTKLYVTSAKNMSIYDISDPASPQLDGLIHMNIAWENEEVPTNGKILGISSDWFAFTPSCGVEGVTGLSCLQLFDVRDPQNVKELPAVPQNGDHTSACVLDCSYFFGSAGSITDLRGVLDGAQPKDLGDWRPPVLAQLAAQGGPAKFDQGCHNVREIRPGIIFTACQPFMIISVNASDGGSITAPKLLAWGANADKRFVHSVRWPRQGEDKFAFEGGETNFHGQCDDTSGTFEVLGTDTPGKLTPLGKDASFRPSNGTYADGNNPVGVTGCSVHWFEEHPSFHDGGLVALAAYDNGTRFLRVGTDGKVTEEGYFQPLGFETSSPKWVPGTDIVYSIDYMRGIDILRWKGKHYVPGQPEPLRIAGTNGRRPVLPALTARQRAFAVRQVSVLEQQGWFSGYCQLIANRRA